MSGGMESMMEDEGWVEWNGGGCPVFGDVFVEVIIDGRIVKWGTANDWDWKNTGYGAITAYRIPSSSERVTSGKTIATNDPLKSQVGGDHYKKLGDYQPWIVLKKWMTEEELKGAMKKEVITYLARESDKGGRVDIEKAMHTLQIYLELTSK